MRSSSHGKYAVALAMAVAIALAGCQAETSSDGSRNASAPSPDMPATVEPNGELTVEPDAPGDTPDPDAPAAKPAPPKPSPPPATAQPVPPPAPPPIPAADAAVDFSLPDLNGEQHELSQYRGKWVVLEWTNYGCPIVKRHYEAGNMQALQREYTGKDVVWLSICSSAPGKQGHMEAKDWPAAMKKWSAAPSAVLLDPAGKVGRLYEAKTTPHMYVISPEGALIYQGAIDDDRRARSKEATLAANNHVRAVLDAAMNGKAPPVTETTPYGCSVKYGPRN